MRRKWQPLAAASSCTPARGNEAAACTQRVALAPPGDGQQVLLHIESGGGELRVNETVLALPRAKPGPGVDITHTLPCTWVMHFRAYEAAGESEGAPTGRLIADTWTSQAVTPRDAESVDYYYSWGASRACEFPGLSELLCDTLDGAFNEDRRALEAQHLRWREKPDHPTIDIVHDAGPGRMLWLLDKALREEAEAGA